MTPELEKVVQALAALVAKETAPEPKPTVETAGGLPPWMSVAEYAAHIRKAPRTVAGWARRAEGTGLAVKYGATWRVAGPAFDAWVRAGGPFRQHEEQEARMH